MKTGNPAPLGVNFSKPWEQSACAICPLLFKFHIVVGLTTGWFFRYLPQNLTKEPSNFTLFCKNPWKFKRYFLSLQRS